MTMVAPSRKIIAVSIVCCALIGSAIYIKIGESKGESQNGVLTAVDLPEIAVSINASEDNTDTDNDQLKDWQEVIQGTDATDPDTDGDGTKDGAEIAAGRNPLKPGPDDIGPSTAELKVGTNEVYGSFVPKSLTDNVSIELFSAYIEAKSQGNTDDLSHISDTIAEETLTKNEMVEKYSVSAIGTFSDSDTTLGMQYGEEFGLLYIGLLAAIQIEQGDLATVAEFYQKFAKSASAMYVPRSLASTQAEIANNFYNIALMFSIVAKSEEDPIRATLALKNIKALMSEHSRLFTAVGNYFIRNDIIFENQDIQILWENI